MEARGAACPAPEHQRLRGLIISALLARAKLFEGVRDAAILPRPGEPGAHTRGKSYLIGNNQSYVSSHVVERVRLQPARSSTERVVMFQCTNLFLLLALLCDLKVKREDDHASGFPKHVFGC